MTTKIFNKIFLHFSGYDGAPEFSIDGDGVVRIDDKIEEDRSVIVRALITNAKAWGKCFDASEEAQQPVVSVPVGVKPESVVRQYTAVELRGPWPPPAGGDPEFQTVVAIGTAVLILFG